MVRFAAILCFILAGPLSGTTAARSAELIMFEQAGCDWCERWNEEIGIAYDKTAEGKIAPLRRVNIHDKLPSDLENVKPGRFTPTFVLVDNNREIDRIRGYPGEDFFWGLLGEMLAKLPKKDDKAS